MLEIIKILIFVFAVSSIALFISGLHFRRKALNKIPDPNLDQRRYFPGVEVSKFLSDLKDTYPEFLCRKLSSSNELTENEAREGLSKIEYIISVIKNSSNHSPHLIGINKGGGFLASYFSHRLDLHEKYIMKCDYRIDLKKIICEPRPRIDGALVIIDDIVKTGTTVSAVKDYLSITYPNTAIFTLVLVVSEAAQEKFPANSLFDFVSWVSCNKEISMPWSKGVENSLPFKREHLILAKQESSFDNNSNHGDLSDYNIDIKEYINAWEKQESLPPAG